MKRMTAVGILAAMMLGAIATDAGAAESTAGRVIDDSAITTKVKAAMLADKDVSSLKVHVRTYKGEVQLNGRVATAEEKAAAEAVASKVEGVEKLKNNLVVDTGRHSAGHMIDDAGITAKVKAAFAESETVKATQIDVSTRNGWVTLSGFADSAESKAEAEQLAKKVEYVSGVKNNVEVRK